MKRNVLIFFIINLLIAQNIFAQENAQIPNSNFEQWTDEHHAEGWNSFDILSLYYTAERSEDAALGDYAVKLKTQDLIFQVVPGTIMLGEVDMSTFSPYGGIPFSSRPTGMTFSHKYLPKGDDYGLAAVILTKWNETTESTDTIGGNLLMLTATQSEYTSKTMPIFYKSLETPDTLNVIFVSSGDNPVAGSKMFVDDVKLVYDLLSYPTLCLPAISVNHQQFTTIWAPLPHAISYRLEVASDSNFDNMLSGYPMEILNGLDASTSVVTPEAPSKYFYRVKVIYLNDESEYSNVVQVVMPVEALAATDVNTEGFKANWSSALNADEYLLYVATDKDFTNILPDYNGISAGSNLGYEVTGLSKTTEYFYRTKTVYGTDTSKVSNTVSVNLSTGLQSVISSDQIKVHNISGGFALNLKSEILPAELEVYDLSGRKIKDQVISSDYEEVKLPYKGVFVLRVKFENSVFNKKIITNF